MIKAFLKERLSWILLFVFLQSLFIFIAYIDVQMPLQSVLYIIYLSVIIFFFFLIVRYRKETTFYRVLANRKNNLDATDSRHPKSPFERIVDKSITEQTEALHTALSSNRIMLEQEQDELLSWIHEIKTPLTAMHLMIERLEDDTLKEDLKFEWLRIYLLLDRQLHQKRLPSMENDLYIEKTSVESLLYQEIKMLQSWCIQKGIGFDLQLDMKEVLTDAKWLAFIIRQLLSNAVKYSEASDISIKSYEQHGQTILEVTDTGRGIDAKDLPRIFDRGFTSTTDHQDHTSTGMGLYLSKKVADRLQIHIQVQSTPGEGTTFSLTFPKRNAFVQMTSV